jgi:hypothetical protein
MTSHAPMVAEALCALGRPDAVTPWLERYRADALQRPPRFEPIDRVHWRGALAKEKRFSDWSAFFADELAEAPWRLVLDRWVARLAPGFCSAATHGVIRVGHAARALGEVESPRRMAELADALASWASTYQELPTSHGVTPHRATTPTLAIARVPVVPPEQRRLSGTIVASLEGLSAFPDFAPVIGLLDAERDPGALVSELSDVFARVFLANARDALTAVVFAHGVTSIAALGNLLPHVREPTARAALPFAWQSACGLYAAFGSRPPAAAELVLAIERQPEDPQTLVDRAIAHGDEHAIKLAEACISSSARGFSPAFGAAACRALELLPPV